MAEYRVGRHAQQELIKGTPRTAAAKPNPKGTRAAGIS